MIGIVAALIANVPLQVSSDLLLAQIFNGLVLGMIYVLIALGLTIIFGIMGIINFAHGEFLLVGVYVALSASVLTGSYWAGLIAAPLVVALLGIAVERFTLRPIYDRDVLLQLLLTFGLAEIIREGVQIIWGRTGRSFATPAWGAGRIDLVLFEYPVYRLFVILVSALVVVGVYLYLTQTDVGLVIRAAIADRQMVNSLGIDVTNMYVLVFALGAAIAGLAGGLVGPLRNARPLLGFELIIPAFVVVVVGGLGSIRGTILAGLLIGQAVGLTGLFYPPGSEVIIYILMAIVLLVRPRGLFGREVELE